MINNFEVIENFLQFEEGAFYKFELLVRNTDGENNLYLEGCSSKNKNILIKSWYIDNREYYDKVKHEMITLADITGARLYVTLDRKDNAKVVQSVLHSFVDILYSIYNSQKRSIKSISKAFASETSKVENSSKVTRTIMFDVDTKEETVLKGLTAYIESKGQTPYILETRKGFHVFCYRKFNHSDWQTEVCDTFLDKYREEYKEKNLLAIMEYLVHSVKEFVSVKENELGLVYHPMKGEKNDSKT